ncbi:MAG: hypothetical protein AAGJ18_17350 [Bacteroidota bacterium]
MKLPFLKYKILFVVCFLLNVAAVAATTTTTDKCLIHLDKSFYVTGEIAWYQLYLPQTFKTKPVAIRATVLDNKGVIVHSSFLQTEGKTAVDGYYKIPFNLKSGVYVLQFSSINKAKKSIVALVETQIPIYNDLEGVAKTVSAEGNKTMPQVKALPNELDIEIQLPTTNPKTRAKVQPTITVKDKLGKTVAANLSVSVVDYEVVGADLMGSTTIRTGEGVDGNVVSILSDDLYLKGIVNQDKGGAHAGKVLGAYTRVDDKILYTRSNEEGGFYLAVPTFYGNRGFQILGQQTDYQNIRVNPENQLPINSVAALPFNDQIADYLALSRQRKKIFQRYGTVESNLKPQKYTVSRKSVKADAAFVIKEYEDFEFMSIFFKENLTPLRFEFQDQDSSYIAKMYNPKNQSAYDKFFRGRPLIIVDDIVTRNGDFLARMRMTDVEKVELYYDLKKLNKQYKLFGSNGVTKITTYDKIESLPVFEADNMITVNGVQKAADFPVFDPAEINNDRLQPFFRPQLYWNADLTTKKDGQAIFNYFQTDDRSTFEIRVVAQSEDGKVGYKTMKYEVK